MIFVDVIWYVVLVIGRVFLFIIGFLESNIGNEVGKVRVVSYCFLGKKLIGFGIIYLVVFILLDYEK